jgi:predicted HTH transcriptional regulator
VWNALDDKSFLEKLGGYGKDRSTGVEGLTLAGLLMFGTGQAVRDRFSNIFMDYRNESEVTADIRWNDRITYDGTWENNLFNFFMKVTPKLTEDLEKPFKLQGLQRIDETPVHKAVREAFVNLIIHADYLMDAGVLKIIKRNKEFEFTNPGILKLPLDDIYRGGNSRSRNPHMQTMLRMVGFGDNAGSGFPTILDTWSKQGWVKPELMEDTILNQVTLVLKMVKDENKNVIENVTENVIEISEKKIQELMTGYSKKKIARAYKIVKIMIDNPQISIDDMRKALDVTDRTIARYISDLKKFKIIDRVGPDNGGSWKVLL